MVNGRMLNVFIIAVWIVVILLLASHANLVFKILVYSDNKVLPRWTSASVVSSIVSSYLGNQTSLVVIPVYVGDVNNSQYVLEGVDQVLRSLNLSYYDLNKVYDVIINRYNDVTNETVRDYVGNYTAIVNNIYINESLLCSELYNISSEYYNTYSNYTSTISEFSSFYSSFLRVFFLKLSASSGYDYPTSRVINETASTVLANNDYPSWLMTQIGYFITVLNASIGSLSTYGLNVTTINGALSSSYGLTLARINSTYMAMLRNITMSNPLAVQVIALGRNPPRSLVAKLVAYQFINSTPLLIKPYLTQLACSNRSQVNQVMAELNSSLRFIVLSAFSRPPYSYANNVTNGSLYSDGYSLVVVNSTNDVRIYDAFSNYDYVYPFSTGIVLNQLSRMIESDVPVIDEVSSILVLTMLLFVLGTLVAPLVILLILVLTYGAVLGVIYLIGVSGLTVYYLTVYMVSPIVFGIGVDYSLLIVGRYLEERRRGSTVPQALNIITRMTVPTVLTSGGVVAAGLGSFVASNYQYIQVIGLSFIVTVALVILTTTVVLPSLVSIMGDGILWPMGLRSSTRELSTRLIVRLTRFSIKRPWLVLSIALVFTALSVALLLQTPLTSNPIILMPNIKPIQAYKILLSHFPNYIESTQYIVIEPPNPGALSAIISDVGAFNFTRSINVAYNSSSMIILKVTTSYTALSDRLIPVYLDLAKVARQVAELYGVKVLVGGDAANKYYFVSVFERQFYGEIALLIIALNIIILSIALRSIVIPLRLLATVMMSMAWALAISQVVFYRVLGIETYWLMPIILYALLTSVGTDYDIFIVSRIREEVIKGRDDPDAILVAVENTGPIVTGAAMVLAMAFMSLMASQLYILREIGFTVGLSVLIDAFIIRPAVMPAIMVLAGKYNWWPSRLPTRIKETTQASLR